MNLYFQRCLLLFQGVLTPGFNHSAGNFLPFVGPAILFTKRSFIASLCFPGMNFLELSLSLGILDLSRLFFDLSLLTAYTLRLIANVPIV